MVAALALIVTAINVFILILFSKTYTKDLLTNRWISIKKFNALKASYKDFRGVYIIKNVSKTMYYVGQSLQVIHRVGNHLRGYGNGDVYADIKRGDKFKIYLMKFNRLRFKTLNDMERYYIKKYDSYNSGYNRNQGNN